MNRTWLIWLTGLPGSGKSTLAGILAERLRARNMQVFQLDGDEFRRVFGADLGFTAEDRSENLRRASCLAHYMVSRGTNVVASFVSPYRADRERIRELFPSGNFMEVFLRCPLDVCEERDPKGLYARARRGEITSFTGISDPYEDPRHADLVLDTDLNDIETCVEQLEAITLRLLAPVEA